MHLVCELCKSRSPLPVNDNSKLSYCWSNASYSDWLAHILSDVHQENSLARLTETLNITKTLSLEDDDVEIRYYPRSSSILVHGKFPYDSVDKRDFIGEFLQHGFIHDVTFLSVQPETFYILVFEMKNTVNQLLKQEDFYIVNNQKVKLGSFSYCQCISILESNNGFQIASAENGSGFADVKSQRRESSSFKTFFSDSDFSDAKSEPVDAGDCQVRVGIGLTVYFPLEMSFPVPKTPIDAEFQALMKEMGLTTDELVKRSIVLDKLEVALKEDFPYCKVTPCGSIVTGIGTSKSSIEISICENTSSEKALEKIRHSLESTKSFVDIVIQPVALRPPAIKCTHITPEITCDISLNNEIGIQRTRLISFYLDYDPRVRILINTIIYWADINKLMGLDGMTTYTISLMVLVFLTKMEIIPSVKVLQGLSENCKGKIQCDKWNLDFCSDKLKVKEFMSLRDTYSFGNTDVTPLNVLKLVKEFFDFCSRVDLNNNMICTLLCSAFPKSVFIQGNESELPSTLGGFKQWMSSPQAAKNSKIHRFDILGSFSIQDPFNLSLNVSAETTSEVLQQFLRICDQTSSSIDQVISNKNGSATLCSIFSRKTNRNEKKTDSRAFAADSKNCNNWRDISSLSKSKLKSKPISSKSKLKPKPDYENWRNPVSVPKSTTTTTSPLVESEKEDLLQNEFERMMTRISLSEDDFKEMVSVVEEMKKILLTSFPKCQVKHFGSTFTRLGGRHSLIDVSFHHYLNFQENVSHMQHILELLVRGQQFSNLRIVTDRTEPIWQCMHTETLLVCNIFHSNELGIQTSHLILVYLELDSRIRPLSSLICHMAGCRQLKNSSLTLLVLFYLMYHQIIPCVQVLQNLSEEPMYIDGWKTSFCTNLEEIKEHQRNSKEYLVPAPMHVHSKPTARSVLELAHEFFKFYSAVDFQKNVLCTFLGKLIPKDYFKPENESSLLPPLRCKETFCSPNSIVLQHPLNLGLNVENGSDKRTITRFQTFCKQAANGFFELLCTSNKVITLHHVINGTHPKVYMSSKSN